jgi:hypothetical protein
MSRHGPCRGPHCGLNELRLQIEFEVDAQSYYFSLDSRRTVVLHNFKFKLQFLAAKDVGQVKLPELTGKAKDRPTLIEINDEFQTDGSPEIRERHVGTNGFQLNIGVKRKKLAIIDEAIEGVAVEMITVRRIGGPVRVGVMRSHDRDSAFRLSDAIEFSHEGHNVGNMLGDMTTDDLVEFIIGERIWNRSEIVNYLGMRFWI